MTSSLRSWIRLAFVGVILAATLLFLAKAVAENWNSLRGQWRLFSLPWLSLATILFFLGQLVLSQQWILLVNDLCRPKTLGFIKGASIVNVTQLTKYLPGRVWAYGLQALWLQREGYSPAKVAFAGFAQQLLAILVASAIGSLFAACFLPALPRTLTVSLAIGSCAGALLFFVGYNFFIGIAVRLAHRLLGMSKNVFSLGSKTLISFILLYILFFLLFGGGLYCAARGIGIFLETQQLPAVAGAVLIADLVGLLAIIVPGGIGVREGGIYFFLLPVLGPANAILFPIVTRFLYVVNDLALGAVSAFCIRFFSTKEAGNQSTNNSEMPILLVLSSGYPKAPGDVRGGAPFAHELAKRLTDCFEVHVLTPFCEGTSSFQEMDGVRINRFKYLPKNVRDLTGEGGIADNLRSSPLNYLKVPPLFFFLGLALLAFLWKNRRRSVVVHAHWLIPQGVVAAIVVKLFRKQTRLLCTAHGSDVMGFKAGPIKRLLTYTLKSSDNVSAVSSALGEAISSELAFTGAHIAPMGIDTAEFHPSRKSTELRRLYGATGPLVLFVGFLVDVKGVDTLLRAFASILPDHPTARLVLVGEGQERFHLESLAKELSISEQTIFAGAMPHSAIAPLMATADLFVGPSLREGFGLVFAEAMSSECVVLASAIPPLQHLIYPGQTGLLAEAANPQSFAMQMDEVMKAPESFEAIRKAARIRIVESFDWEAVARRYRAILQDLIVPRPKPR